MDGILRTERLMMRRFSPEDWQDLYEYLSQEEVVKYEPYDVFTEDQAKEEAVNRSNNPEFVAVCLQGTGKVIGNVYLAEREFDTWELGYVFNQSYHGKGYACEAANALLNDIFTKQGAHRVIAMCNPLNTASWKLLERLGMRREGHLLKNIWFTREKAEKNLPSASECKSDKTDEGAKAGNPVWQDTYEYACLSEEFKEKGFGRYVSKSTETVAMEE